MAARKRNLARALVRAKMIAGETVSRDDIAKENALGQGTVAVAMAYERGRKEALLDHAAEVALPATAKKKLDIVVRKYKRDLDLEYEARIQAECRRRLDQVMLPQYLKELSVIQDLISKRRGVMNRGDYLKVVKCLHSDLIQDPQLKSRYDEALAIFTGLEKYLLEEKESPTQFRELPSTLSELMEMRARRKVKV